MLDDFIDQLNFKRADLPYSAQNAPDAQNSL